MMIWHCSVNLQYAPRASRLWFFFFFLQVHRERFITRAVEGTAICS